MAGLETLRADRWEQLTTLDALPTPRTRRRSLGRLNDLEQLDPGLIPSLSATVLISRADMSCPASLGCPRPSMYRQNAPLAFALRLLAPFGRVEVTPRHLVLSLNQSAS